MITGKYKELYHALIREIPGERLLHDALNTLSFGADASFYRLIPKLIVKVRSESELQLVVKKANELSIPVTFRAAGTSLSGQAISDSVLVIASHGWQNHEVLNNGDRIKLQVGLKGGQANRFLSKYGRKIGPDPASIDSAMIGGIAANNASGMCCGTSENSYKTVADIRVVLSDGTVLDTGCSESRNAFVKSNGHLLRALEEMALRVKTDETLRDRIGRKFKIKNTTGYSLNALVDFSDGFDILKHLMIGSEGTLAFISDITYETVIDHQNKALALAIYPSMELACKAVQLLKNQPVSAVELMDRAAIRSVDSAKGVPEFLKTISKDAAVLLIETKAESGDQRSLHISQISKSIETIQTEFPLNFTTDAKEQAILWKIRKETLPTVAGMRKSGTTSLIEDVCFPVPMLASAALDLQTLFVKHGYSEAVIFGHALEGNLHFMFSPNFNDAAEVDRYSNFMDDVVDLVVDKYDGSLKAEHGTGRNMAPFVEKEWGASAYQLMKEIKQLFDPKGILNPGVILNNDAEIHLKNLKPMVSIRASADKCMECGFCEGVCVSEGFTLSPRQRVVAFREMERLRISNQEPHRAAEIHKLYNYSGLDTCATDGLCNVACPVKIDTGKLIKELRHESHLPWQEKIASSISNNMALITSGMRSGLNVVYYLRLLVGKRIFGAVATGLNKISGGWIPLWNEHVPKGAKKISSKRLIPSQNLNEAPANKVVYFPSCITRSMGVSKAYNNAFEVTQITEKLLTRAGYEILYPKGLNDLCCGMAFSSKGFVEAGKLASDKLEAALIEASENGKYPILCDMSPCLYTMKTTIGDRLKLYEPVEFVHEKLMGQLTIKQLEKKVAVFAVCSAKKMEVDETLSMIASKCAKEVVVIDSNCCGFAGDKGFMLPKLNDHGLRNLKEQSTGCEVGYATSRTCEIGLSKHSGITYTSILHLVEEASR
ncbi:MAG TPA: FAD-binding and (Fe-S)-binding domain-containing protein [Bacteroidales bacterium]|nr:FAD-binding and (Fe-S)-binding domain-containing protein [Bacteroidales bacterium]